MSAYSERMFAGLLGTQRFLMSVGVSRVVRKIPLAYSAYASLYQRWAPRHDVFVESHGQKLFVSPEDMGMARAFLLARGRWEELETRIFSSFLKEGMTFVDVGANIGYYTLLAARLVGSKGQVFAFEPCPDNFRLLERNVKSNGHTNVTLVPKAVSDRSGWATLQLDRSSSGGHTLSNFRAGARSIAVETVSLDDYFTGKTWSIDLVKTDAEGADPAVFQGMRQIVERNPRLVFFTEFFPRAIHGMGFLPESYLRELADRGLQVYFIDEDSGRIEPLEADRISRFIAPLMRRGTTRDVLNLLCMRDFPVHVEAAAGQAGDVP
jgi:FkbM family methyltransferase